MNTTVLSKSHIAILCTTSQRFGDIRDVRSDQSGFYLETDISIDWCEHVKT